MSKKIHEIHPEIREIPHEHEIGIENSLSFSQVPCKIHETPFFFHNYLKLPLFLFCSELQDVNTNYQISRKQSPWGPWS